VRAAPGTDVIIIVVCHDWESHAWAQTKNWNPPAEAWGPKNKNSGDATLQMCGCSISFPEPMPGTMHKQWSPQFWFSIQHFIAVNILLMQRVLAE